MKEKASVASLCTEPLVAGAREGPEILVDADACPVKAEIVSVATRHGMRVTFVANGGLRPSRDPAVRNVIVGAGFDAADDWIVAEARPCDIVITADVPLAARCVARGALVISPQGKAFTSENIGPALAMRDLNQSLREGGVIRGLNAAFTATDRSRFLQALDQGIRKARNMAADRSCR
jgi:uncharacterized protein YaiI (UPF0178 family)